MKEYSVTHDFSKPSKEEKQKVPYDWRIVLALVVQTAGIIWWAATISAATTENTQDIKLINTRLDTSAAVILTRDQLDDVLGSRDANIDALKKEITDFKSEVRDSLRRIENKI